MRIEVVQSPTGLLLVHVFGKERLACEAAYNRFLVDHKLDHWNLVVRANFLGESLFAQSINPEGRASQEIAIGQSSEVRAKLTELMEVELERWLERSSAAQTSG